eukprot:6182557-Pleurochrysis_carterae.AAC.5
MMQKSSRLAATRFINPSLRINVTDNNGLDEPAPPAHAHPRRYGSSVQSRRGGGSSAVDCRIPGRAHAQVEVIPTLRPSGSQYGDFNDGTVSGTTATLALVQRLVRTLTPIAPVHCFQLCSLHVAAEATPKTERYDRRGLLVKDPAAQSLDPLSVGSLSPIGSVVGGRGPGIQSAHGAI